MDLQITAPPLSLRQVADYLGISSSQVCMSNSANYMNRQLSPVHSLKMTQLMETHVLAQQQGSSPSVCQVQLQSRDDCACHAGKMNRDADYILQRLPALEKQLAAMKPKAHEDTAWLNTLDLLMAGLPPATTPKSHERIWLENQEVAVLKRLRKNGALAQVKLEVQIELIKAKARVYREAHVKQAKR